MNEILSREEIQKLLERNNLHPEIGRPVYEAWSHNKGRCFTNEQLATYLKRAGVSGEASHVARWAQRLNSKTFRVTVPGNKLAHTVMRPLKTQKGWTEIPFNGRAK